MRSLTLPPPIVICAVAAGLVLLGHLLFSRPQTHLGYDATFYVGMVDGPMSSAPPPFRFRILVPWLARQLPVPAPLALQSISYASLFVTYIIVMASCRVIGLALRNSIFGVVAVWGSTWHLYAYWNPYMTDAFGLLVLTIMMWAVLTGTQWVFAATSVIGVLAREGTIMLVPAWLITGQWWATVGIAAATSIVGIIPHLLQQPSASAAGAISPFSSLPWTHPVLLFRQLLATWGIVWVWALVGLADVPRPHGRRLGAVLATLAAGAVVSSAFATDMGRMFGFLAPALAVCCAQLHAGMRRREDQVLLAGVTIAVAVQWIFNAPDVVIEPSSWIAGWPRRLFAAAEVLLALAIVGRNLRAAGTNVAAGSTVVTAER